MDDILQIQRVVIGFFVALDSFDVDRALTFVADDIEWIRESGTIHGREEVRRTLENRPRQRRTRHLVANLDVNLTDRQAAQARCDVVVYQAAAEVAAGAIAIKGPDLILSNVDDLIRLGKDWKIRRKSPKTVFKFMP